MEGGSIFLIEPISWIEGQQLDFGSLRQVRGFVNDQPAGLHPSLQRHGDHSSTAQRRVTSRPARPSSGLAFVMVAIAGQAGRWHFAVATPLLPASEIMRNLRESVRLNSIG